MTQWMPVVLIGLVLLWLLPWLAILSCRRRPGHRRRHGRAAAPSIPAPPRTAGLRSRLDRAGERGG